MLSSKGIYVPVLEYIDYSQKALFDFAPKDYENASLWYSVLMTVSSTLVTLLSLIKNIILILGNGKAITGEIPFDKYNMAGNTWNTLVSSFILGIHSAFVRVADFLIDSSAKPFLYNTEQGSEANTVISSVIHAVIGLICCGAIVFYNRRTSNSDEEDEDDDQTGLRRRPVSPSYKYLQRVNNRDYHSDGETDYVVTKRPRVRSIHRTYDE